MRRFAVPLLGVVAFLLAVSFFAAWQVERGNQRETKDRLAEVQGRLTAIQQRQEAAETEARSLVGDLGRLCSGFDFYFKHDMARGAFRPVRCSSNGGANTVLFAYGFDSTRTQDAWVSEYDKHIERRGASLIEGDTWAVEVLDPSILDDVRSLVQASP